MTDDEGRPRALLLSPGNTNDTRKAGDVVREAGPIPRLIADRGYDANHLRDLLAQRGAEADPLHDLTRAPIPYDRDAYRTRNLVERMWAG